MVTKPTYFVTGANGFIGTFVVQNLQQRQLSISASGYPASEVGVTEVNLTDQSQVQAWLESAQAGDGIIHTAAQANVEYCEAEPAASAAVNVQGTQYLIDAARHKDLRLVFISSEYVFPGGHGPYKETDQPAPINIYGQQKLQAEQAIAAQLTNYVIIRTTTVFGPEAVRKNFMLSLIDRTRKGQMVLVPTDQLSTPTFAIDLANVICQLAIQTDRTGVYHAAGPELMSRIDFAQLIATTFELDHAFIKPVTTADLGQVARRPLAAGLATTKLASLNLSIRPVRQALDYVQEIYGLNP